MNTHVETMSAMRTAGQPDSARQGAEMWLHALGSAGVMAVLAAFLLPAVFILPAMAAGLAVLAGLTVLARGKAGRGFAGMLVCLACAASMLTNEAALARLFG